MSAESKPLFIIFSGSPASGKSSLAEKVADNLGLPLLSRDDIKEAIMDVIPVDDVDQSHLAGAAAFKALYRILDRLLDAGAGAVVESTFERGRSEVDLHEPLSRSRPLQINCVADAETIKERLAFRIASGSRHPGHQDRVAYVEIEQALLRGDYEPLDIDVPLIQVDTSASHPIDIPALITEVRKILR